MSWRALTEFPNPVNEKAARTVAAGVVGLALLTIVTSAWWLAALMAAGFTLRVLAGPRFSPLGRLAASGIAPHLGAPRLVPGPPKRFAQAIGLAFTTAAAVALGLGATGIGVALLAVLVVFALLEAGLGFCAGCWVFGQLMRLGVIPAETCAACNDISLRRSEVVPTGV
jgi:hypothetical protein